MAAPVLLVDWSIAAVIGVGIAWGTTHLDRIHIDRARGRVSLPGSVLPLIRNLLIFATKYVLTAAAVILPASRANLALWDIAVSGLSAGYFLGWLARLAWLIGARRVQRR